jgi:hypothetical protein
LIGVSVAQVQPHVQTIGSNKKYRVVRPAGNEDPAPFVVQQLRDYELSSHPRDSLQLKDQTAADPNVEEVAPGPCSDENTLADENQEGCQHPGMCSGIKGVYTPNLLSNCKLMSELIVKPPTARIRVMVPTPNT